VSGLIAAVSGKTLQVQGTAEQTAVTYTSKTTFTEQTSAKASDLKTGMCVTVRSSGDASASPATTVAASAVTLSAATDGSCAGGFGGGARPSGAPSGAPSGMPSAGAGGRAGMGAFGKVTSVDGSSFVVQSTRGEAGTTNIAVTTSASTTWEQTAKTTAKAVAVGKCATATGATSGTGALTATTLRLSKASNGTCSTGFGGGGRGGQQPGGTASNG
jgi:hypothetical protein